MSLESLHAHSAQMNVLPPSSGPLRRATHTYDLMRQCIHCGFCLPTCPTYAVLGVEMDSPRGRIYQMQAVAEGRIGISDEFIEHMYCCVGCRACETACPSGVQFGKLIEAAREQIQLDTPAISADEGADTHGSEEYDSVLAPTKNPRRASLLAKLVRYFFFNVMLPSRLVTSLTFAGLKLYQRSGLQTLARLSGLIDAVNTLPTPFQGKIKLPEELMPRAGGELIPHLLPEITSAIGERRYRVGMISGCIMDQLFRNINEATIRVLAANGCEVITPPQQQCCGALHVHAGEAERGRELARHNIDVFEPYNCDAIIINSAGCGSTLKEYEHLLRDDPDYAERAKAFSAKMKDVSEFLAGIERNQDMGAVPTIVAYHDACHLVHGQKIRQQPRQLLEAIPGVTLVPLKEADWCCGSAGIYNITNQEMGTQLLERKMDNIEKAGASIIATGNPGCMMQIALGAKERGLEIDVVHPVQLLDKAYAEGGAYSVPVRDTLNEQQLQRIVLLGVGLAIGAAIGLGMWRRRRQ